MRLFATGMGLAAGITGCGDSRPSSSSSAPPSQPPTTIAAPSPFEIRDASSKPAPPLDLQFWFESDPSPGADVKIGLAVTPRIDLADCELTFLPPDDVPVTAGAREWRGALSANRRQTIFPVVRAPDGARRVLRAQAQAAFPDGTRLNRYAELILNPGAPAKPSGPGGELKTNDRGEQILEFQAETR
jgi:hypothetical protein